MFTNSSNVTSEAKKKKKGKSIVKCQEVVLKGVIFSQGLVPFLALTM